MTKPNIRLKKDQLIEMLKEKINELEEIKQLKDFKQECFTEYLNDCIKELNTLDECLQNLFIDSEYTGINEKFLNQIKIIQSRILTFIDDLEIDDLIE